MDKDERIKELENVALQLFNMVHESDLIQNKIKANDLYDIIVKKYEQEQLNIPVVSDRKIVRCKDPMVCLRGCSVHEQTCKHPIYER